MPRKYKFTLTVEVLVEAENVAQAFLEARAVRAIGARYGSRRHKGCCYTHCIDFGTSKLSLVRDNESKVRT